MKRWRHARSRRRHLGCAPRTISRSLTRPSLPRRCRAGRSRAGRRGGDLDFAHSIPTAANLQNSFALRSIGCGLFTSAEKIKSAMNSTAQRLKRFSGTSSAVFSSLFAARSQSGALGTHFPGAIPLRGGWPEAVCTACPSLATKHSFRHDSRVPKAPLWERDRMTPNARHAPSPS